MLLEYTMKECLQKWGNFYDRVSRTRPGWPWCTGGNRV